VPATASLSPAMRRWQRTRSSDSSSMSSIAGLSQSS
jgi:hypothetical protein